MLGCMTDQVLIVGTGFAGLAVAILLKQAGIHDFTLLEQADEVGGTWRDNHYPGAACDVMSHLYSFSFEPNPSWSRSFAPQREILDYLRRCADAYGIRPHIRFRSTVTRARWDERDATWEVETSDGRVRRARALISGCGGLSRPATPDIPGLDRFEGPSFHSARWDHEQPLAGKRVAVIGTGASAIQIVPSIAPVVSALHVFQRTPPWILPKDDHPISPRAQALYRALPPAQKLARLGIYLRNEVFATGFVHDRRVLLLGQRMAKRYLERCVPDPVLREKLTPRYAMGCKRVLLSNDYYQAIQRPNVALVTEGIREVRARSIVTNDGRERDVDALVLATGFQAAEACAPFEVRGRGGRDLSEAWRDGAEAYLGTTVSGFPNLFLIVGPNTGLGHSSMVFMIESQARYVVDALRTMRARGLRAVDVRADAQAAYNREIQARLAKTVWQSGGCTSWYQTRTGKNTTLWPGYTFEFRLRTRAFDPSVYDVVSGADPAHVGRSRQDGDASARAGAKASARAGAASA